MFEKTGGSFENFGRTLFMLNGSFKSLFLCNVLDFDQLQDDENQPYLVLQEIAGIVKMLEQDRIKIKGDIERERKMVIRLQERLDEFVEKTSARTSIRCPERTRSLLG